MVMILLETKELYANSIKYFLENIIDSLPNDPVIWKKVYHEWLLDQRAVIVKSKKMLIMNSLGVCPGYDHFGFKNKKDAILFILRWS